jgi:16S rRNA (guanine966-N2)-methyltransferase
MLKILGGQFKSRKLKTPRDNETTRPWTGRARESVFNQLRGHLNEGIVLDLFAGVGTMGLEAISRGSHTVIMVEKDRKIFDLLHTNIEAMGCSSKAIAIHGDALSSVPLLRAPHPIDIAFVDPPYAMMANETFREKILEQVANIGAILHDEGLIVLRSPMDPNLQDHSVDNLVGPEIHKEATNMWILFYGKKAI